MPTIDSERDILVVRLVYDGPPMAGKTTTLRALAELLGAEVTTPAESDGRTLFFDWVEYVGGLFDGRQIRCQIVTVPGQEHLAARRALLLSQADVVIFVADTRAPRIGGAMAHLRDLVARCRSASPPVGIVLQANKRDAMDSVPGDEVRALVNAVAPVAVVESIATEGDGVREAFVFAVRLAIDRARTMLAAGELDTAAGRLGGPNALLAEMTALEQSALQARPRPAPAKAGVAAAETEQLIDWLAPHRERAGEAPQPPSDELPFAPDPLAPGGFIWPPVDGRTYLYEVEKLGLRPLRTKRGDWWASGKGWRFHSASRAVFDDVQRARDALLGWARFHAANLPWLSDGRTVILADAGEGRYRLWQLVRSKPSLRERLAHHAVEQPAPQLAEALGDAATHLVGAHQSMRAAGAVLPCTLWTLSVDEQRGLVFSGLMPEVENAVADEVEPAALVERELHGILVGLVAERDDYPAVVRALQRRGAAAGESPIATLAELAARVDAVTPTGAAGRP